MKLELKNPITYLENSKESLTNRKKIKQETEYWDSKVK